MTCSKEITASQIKGWKDVYWVVFDTKVVNTPEDERAQVISKRGGYSEIDYKDRFKTTMTYATLSISFGGEYKVCIGKVLRYKGPLLTKALKIYNSL